MSQVLTTRGLVERSQLRTRDVVQENEQVRVVATEWFLGEELVRRDVWANAFRPLEAA